jgi:hypothetical protein
LTPWRPIWGTRTHSLTGIGGWLARCCGGSRKSSATTAQRLQRVCKRPPIARRPFLPVLCAKCPHSPSPRLPSDKIEDVSCGVGTNAEVPEVGATSVVTWCFHVLAILDVDVITTSAGNGRPNKGRCPWKRAKDRAVRWRHLLWSGKGNRRWSLRVATGNASRQGQHQANKQCASPRISNMPWIQRFRSLCRSKMDCKYERPLSSQRWSRDWAVIGVKS